MPIHQSVDIDKEINILNDFYHQNFGKKDNVFDWDYINNKFYTPDD